VATEGKNGSGSLSNSLTDLMTSLMVIFVLLLVATLNNVSANGENTRNSILDQLKAALHDFEKEGVKVEKDPTDPLVLLVLVSENSLNFEVDESTISDDGHRFLAEFTPILVGATCGDNFVREVSSVVVEGHTDSSGTDEHNLPLSQQRSLAVVQEMLSILGKRQDGERECFLNFVSATGRGSRDPRKSPQGQEDKASSRRVEFKIRVRSLEQHEIRTLVGM
jgi:outer membrane protein OmpA-like peptidoglycan-associated protein